MSKSTKERANISHQMPTGTYTLTYIGGSVQYDNTHPPGTVGGVPLWYDASHPNNSLKGFPEGACLSHYTTDTPPVHYLYYFWDSGYYEVWSDTSGTPALMQSGTFTKNAA